jgi:hypothetical protein
LIESSSGKSKEKERGSKKRKENSEEKMRRRFSQNQPRVSHLSAACSRSNSTRRPRNTCVMRLKGKCALGPFLSILVITCPTQVLKCETMPNGGQSANQYKGMILDLVHWFLWTNVFF